MCRLTGCVEYTAAIHSAESHEFAVFIGKTVNQIFEGEIYIDRTDEFVKDVTKQQMKELAGKIEEE